ncbi:MAG: non-ribosomal peptide synthetase [Acidimicrobiia bacterium]
MPGRLTVRQPADFVPFPKEDVLQGIHERFEDQVRLHADRLALLTRDAAHTYRDTNARANAIAYDILSAAGKQLGQAAILLPNDTDAIVSILAVLKAHKAYVPLDPNFPEERLRTILDDSESIVLLTDDDRLELAERLAQGRMHIVNISQLEYEPDAPDPQVPCDPLDRAYILYTSGSTGKPKGIAFVHRNLLHTTMCLTNQLYFSPSDRVSWLHSFGFSASVVDIYCSLANGATLCPWDAKTQGLLGLSDWLTEARVSTFQWIPSAFRQFLKTVPDQTVFNDIRMVVMASEPLTVREAELFRQYFPEGSHLVNQLGTTESYNYHLYCMDRESPLDTPNIPGGYPVSEDRAVLILDEQLNEVGSGATGEIAIQSDYMSVGYWHDEDLTRKRFITIGDNDTPTFISGDLGRREPDGCLIHLGRKDSQVKVRGYRIELAEVEYRLAGVPGILDCVAGVVNGQLVGYVVLEDGHSFDKGDAEGRLEVSLPDYMVPRRYMVLESLPVLPTGKIDRKSMPNPYEGATTSGSSTAVEVSPLEREILDLFVEVLEVGSVELDSNFFDLGGDSLATAVLISRIHQLYGVETDIDAFMDRPTAACVVRLVGESRRAHRQGAGH